VIPALINGVLPEGIHSCTIDEVDRNFGRFQRSDRRIRLTEKLRALADEARKSGIVAALIVDGSYITGKEEPGDIDLVIVLRQDFDRGRELRPFEYNIQSKRMIRQFYHFDAHVAVDGSDLYFEAIGFFSQVRLEDQQRAGYPSHKGILRIDL
jgi:predicted nucleotidyltransferase